MAARQGKVRARGKSKSMSKSKSRPGTDASGTEIRWSRRSRAWLGRGIRASERKAGSVISHPTSLGLVSFHFPSFSPHHPAREHLGRAQPLPPLPHCQDPPGKPYAIASSPFECPPMVLPTTGRAYTTSLAQVSQEVSLAASYVPSILPRDTLPTMPLGKDRCRTSGQSQDPLPGIQPRLSEICRCVLSPKS